MDWRFLSVADDEPGFLTAWLQPRSLQQTADRREEECQNRVLADFAKEIGVHGVFATPHSDSHVSQDGKENGIHGGLATGHNRNRVTQGDGIETLGEDNVGGRGGEDSVEHAVEKHKERGERENIEHVGHESITATTSLDESDDNSSHQVIPEPEPPQVGVSEKKSMYQNKNRCNRTKTGVYIRTKTDVSERKPTVEKW